MGRVCGDSFVLGFFYYSTLVLFWISVFSLFLGLLFKYPKLVSDVVIYPTRRNYAIRDMGKAKLKSQFTFSTK